MRVSGSPDLARFLEGKIAWVTGGATGCGRKAAIALAKAGADVAIGTLLDLHHKWTSAELRHSGSDELDSVLDAIAIAGSRGVGGHLNLRSEESIGRFCSHVTGELGAADILVHAAPVSFPPRVAGQGTDAWLPVLDSYLNGSLQLIREALPAMRDRRWGRIISIATPVNRNVVHGAAIEALREGLRSLIRGIAVEATPRGIGCFSIAQDTESRESPESLIVSLCRNDAMALSGEEVMLSTT